MNMDFGEASFSPEQLSLKFSYQDPLLQFNWPLIQGVLHKLFWNIEFRTEMGSDDCLVQWNPLFQWKFSHSKGQKRTRTKAQVICLQEEGVAHSDPRCPLLFAPHQAPGRLPEHPKGSTNPYLIIIPLLQGLKTTVQGDIVNFPKSHCNLNLRLDPSMKYPDCRSIHFCITNKGQLCIFL